MQRSYGLRLVALVCIMMMPLQFKGGAADVHPHAFFQFWSDAEAAPHHHGGQDETVDEAHPHDAHTHEAVDHIVSTSMAADPAGDEPSSSATVAPPGMIGIGQVAGFALAMIPALIVLASDRLRGRQREHELLNGRVVTPPVPPPRPSSVRFAVSAN